MKLKQRMVVLCAVLLLLGLAKIFLLDGGEGSAASRRDLRAFRKVRVLVSCCHLQLCLKNIYIYIKTVRKHIYLNIITHCVIITHLSQMEAGLSLSRGARLTHTLQSPWEIASQWVGPREVYPEETPELAAVLTSLSTARIERADVGYKGTQLKALLVLDGGQKVVFKPKR